ncbi:hypothetical protein IKE72_02000 [Candidatus Saccharibacteria bacterium]|nr:hypothetical protein [Candidatus Saccharibacteria bacterium]
MNNNKKNIRTVGIIVVCLAVVALIAAGIALLMNGTTSGDVVVEGNGKIVTLKCTDNTLTHPTLTKYKPVSFMNTITANFNEDTLSSIMYQYDGEYESEDMADAARDEGGAVYNIILAKDYNEKIDVFSHVFTVNGTKMSLTITGKADKVSSRTAPYFFLDTQQSFPKKIDKMKAAYEAKNFSCKIMD